MIIRPLVLRHGRLALPRPTHSLHSWRRYLASEAQSYQRPSDAERAVDGQSTTPLSSHSNTTHEPRDPTHPIAQDWTFFHHQKDRTKDLGTTIGPHYKPHELLSNPPRPQDITLELLMASQAHVGHATSLWHPANAKYIFGVRGRHDPIHIISLDITAAYLRRACKIVRGVTSRGGMVLFVGTREGQARTVVRAAQMAKGCHLFTKWIPGSITNGQQILGACRKKVVDENDNEVLGFQDQLVQSSALKPDLVVCLNPLENYILLHECGLHNIPTIGIVDTDVNPTWVTYPIPANDDSLRCVQVLCGVLGRAGEEGQAIRLGKASQGILSSLPSHGLEPPTEGQAQKETEAAARELLAEQAYLEEGEIVEGEWRAAEEQDAHVEQLVVDDADKTGDVLEGSDADEMSGNELDGSMELDSSLRHDQSDEGYADEDLQAYIRDRPLSEEELSQEPVGQGEAPGFEEAERRER